MKDMQIKICGLSTLETAQAAVDAGASHIGFVYFKRSPRNVTPVQAAAIANAVKGNVKKVIVTVNASDELLAESISLFKPDFIQLHGTEDVARAKEVKAKFGIPLFKAISVSSKDDLKKADEFADIADYILFDAKPPKGSELPGGNAVSFDWEILKDFKPAYKYILSGGLNPQNIRHAIEITGTSFIDTSSGVESSPGVKDISLIKDFIKKASN